MERSVDDVGRYEDLQQSYDGIFKKIGIPTTSLAITNPSKHGPCIEYCDNELCEIVSDFYKDDLQLFS